LCFQRISRGDQAKRALWGQMLTEPAAGKPPHGSGRHLGQQRRVLEQELPACSAADHLNGLSIAANRSSQDRSCFKPMQACFVRGDGSPCSHARQLAFTVPDCRSLQPIAWGLRVLIPVPRAGQASHATHACALSRSLEWTCKAAALLRSFSAAQPL
jgi:hypothetical protein